MKQNKDTPPFSLHVEMLKTIDLTLYPKQKTHYLAFALQFGLKLPSKQAMNRSERRNQIKSGSQKAEQKLGKQIFQPKKSFVLPSRYADIVFEKRHFRKRTNRVKGRNKDKKIVIPAMFKKKGKAKKNEPIFPPEIVKKEKKLLQPKERIICFRPRSTEWLVLRAQRQKFRQQIEKYRAKHPKMEEEKKVPEYFRKKKANQKRRREEKSKLIQENKQALIDIFGNAVFSKGWPISRKQIKLALGIEQDNSQRVEGVNQFIRMAENVEELEGEKITKKKRH